MGTLARYSAPCRSELRIADPLKFNDGETGTGFAAKARPDLWSFSRRGSGQCYPYDLKFGSGLAFANGVFGISGDKGQTLLRGLPVSCSQDARGESGVWLRVRILNSLVFSLRTTVRAIRDSLRVADQSFSAKRLIMGSVSESGTSCSNVSSTEIDRVGRFGTTGFSSIPRVSSYNRPP